MKSLLALIYRWLLLNCSSPGKTFATTANKYLGYEQI